MNHNIKLSVHQLVDFLLRRGDIDTRIFNQETMQEGTRIHLRYQSIQDGSYESEVALSKDIEYDNFIFTLHGRADGVIHKRKLDIIDEIKSTNDDLEHFHEVQGEWHLGQAICYAYLYASLNDLDEMGIRLTYISQIDATRTFKEYKFDFKTLEEKVFGYLREYLNFYNILLSFKEERIKTSKELPFPYDVFRTGQREVAKYVYKVSLDGGLFFFEAPTGTGKTISALYPAIKTFASENNDKIFYLSAKTQAKEVAHNAMKVMTRKGLKAHSIVLSSKEQMCQCNVQKCNPDDCPFAKAYYEKINKVVKEILLKEKCIDKDIILHYSLLYGICPFETQLDVSTYCDVIICDYNYFFDPIVYLKRFFEDGKTPYFALIDEAHNLYERTKEMYTITIEESKLIELQSSLRRVKAIGLKRALKKLILYINDNSNDVEEHKIIENDFDPTFYSLIEKLNNAMLEVSKNNADIIENEFLEVSRMLNRFKKIHDYLDDNFVTYIQKENDSITYYIRCIDSSSLIKDSLDQVRGAVLFSATMTPMDYYIKTLGGNDDTPYLKLPSPFDKKNLCLLVRSDISTRYRDRANSYLEVAKSIKEVVSAKTGNYLVFFSSFQYLESVLNAYDVKDEEIIVQSKEMNISSREEFLSHFIENPNKTTVGFAVLGGVFSEGIDLVNDRLIGAVIVGVGLPMVSFERDLIKDYFDKKGLDGFDYAYTNPGKNKVMQAAGRVIRSKDDKGVVLLIDQRFMQANYRDLFKLEWSHYQRVYNTSQINSLLKQFWDGNK